MVEVADAGRPIPAAGPAVSTVPGPAAACSGCASGWRCTAGELDAGPRPGGGWLVRARLPVDPPAATGAQPPAGGFAARAAEQR